MCAESPTRAADLVSKLAGRARNQARTSFRLSLASYRETAVPESITGRRQPPNSSSKRGRGACTNSCVKDSLFANRCFDGG